MAPKRKAENRSSSVVKKAKPAIEISDFNRLTEEFKENSTKKLNNIAILLSYYAELDISQSSDTVKLRSLTASLFKIFETLIPKRSLNLKKSSDEATLKITKWLKAKYSAYTDLLFTYLSHGSDSGNDLVESFQLDILDIVMRLLKLECRFFAPNVDEPYFSVYIYRRLITVLLTLGSIDTITHGSANGINMENFLLIEFQQAYFVKYWDLRYYFVTELGHVLESLQDESAKRVFYSNFLLISKTSIYTDFTKDTETNYSSNPVLKQIQKKPAFKSSFEQNWLQVLNFPLLPSQYRQTLLILHKRIIPFFQNPTKLMDFLTDSYSIGFDNAKADNIVISILALNGLFELMKNYNLEYPKFYENLYAVLNNQLLHLHYKSRFFRMLDLFLSSTHLPSNLIASFIKRLSRLALTAPPSGLVIVIPFIYNLLKKHPTCMTLIHNTTAYTAYTDPFNSVEADPLKTTALESSLWELNTVMNHYHPNVASLAKIFSQPFNKYSYNLEDFLDWNYTNLLNSELTKKFKGDLSLEFEKVDRLVGEENGYMDTWTW